jgi:hypothetical protein
MSCRTNRLNILPHHQIPRYLLESCRLWVELRSLDELEEQVGDPLAQATEAVLRPATIQEIRFTINEVNDLARQVAIEFLFGWMDQKKTQTLT